MLGGPVKLGPLTRNIFRRYWPICIFLVALWLSTSTFAPRRYRLRFFRPKRPSGGRHPPLVHVAGGDLWAGRANEVRKAFVHAYSGYQKYALPHDELKPSSAESVDNFHGWGVTMYDSLDTMWLMGLEDMFYETVEDISSATFPMNSGEYAHFFEVVIRYLGGLLGAYALSEDPRLLKLADDLGEKLLPAFDTPSGFPLYGVNTATGETSGPDGHDSHFACLAESHSNQLEFKYLAHLTGKLQFYEATERPMMAMYGQENVMYDGLFGKVWDLHTGKPNQTEFTAGGCADSAYEYFLKQWLMTGQKEPKLRDLYIRSANAIIEHLLYVGPHRELLYATGLKNEKPTNHYEHLTCFLPALLALGVHTRGLGLSAAEQERHMWAAEGLANTCWTMYKDTKSGLSPDSVVFDQWTVTERGRWAARLAEWERAGRVGSPPGVPELERHAEQEGRGYTAIKDAYLLRPETVETFYLMWRTTGDVKWRERGWAVFQALEKYSRVRYGYTSVRYLDEKRHAPFRFDDMPSWFLAETLKYLSCSLRTRSWCPLTNGCLILKPIRFPCLNGLQKK